MDEAPYSILEGRIMDVLINQSKFAGQIENNSSMLLHIQDRINIQGSEYKSLAKELAEQKNMILTQDTRITSALRTIRFFMPSILVGCLSLVSYLYMRNESVNNSQSERIMQLQLSEVKHYDRLNTIEDRLLKIEFAHDNHNQKKVNF